MDHISDARDGVVQNVERTIYNDGKTISYAFLEFPSNPILVCIDLKDMRRIADKYNFPLVADDTLGSFCNIGILSVTDILIISCTKSFCGRQSGGVQG